MQINSTNQNIPEFDRYVCPGDSIQWEYRGFTLGANIVYDANTHITDFECYSDEDVTRWKENDWFFGGIVITASKSGIVLAEHAASLWGIECNIVKENSYLTSICAELQDEAIEVAEKEKDRIIQALQG